ncbi:MAG: hypothetical protein JO116_01765, partial [Planctomycetaceae bacterium]|nr:hypothetical protein [Planctomycetaceae bacterium]
CGITVGRDVGGYVLRTTVEDAEGLLPFPDPQLSFAEMAELAQCPGAAGKRLGELLQTVINLPAPTKRRAGRSSRSSPKKGSE